MLSLPGWKSSIRRPDILFILNKDCRHWEEMYGYSRHDKDHFYHFCPYPLSLYSFIALFFPYFQSFLFDFHDPHKASL